MHRIELSPFTFPHSPSRIFTGSKQTSLLTVDLRTGQQLDCFSSMASNTSADAESCLCENEQLLDNMDGRARSNADILFVGRTDYRLTIHSPSSASHLSSSSATPSLSGTGAESRGSSIQEITYSTYTPNSFDKPLAEFWSQVGANRKQWADDGSEASPMRIELGHDGVAVGVKSGGGVKWISKLGSIGIGVYDILLPLSPSAKPILVPQPPPKLETLLPMPSNPNQEHFDIHKKPPTTYIGSVPHQLAITDGSDSDGKKQKSPSPPPPGARPLLYALSSASYPLINFAPPPRPGSLANGSFPLTEDLPEKDQLLPYLLDPPAETEKTIDGPPGGDASFLDGLQRRRDLRRTWIFWIVGILTTMGLAMLAVFRLGKRSTVKQTATPPNEKEPLMAAVPVENVPTPLEVERAIVTPPAADMPNPLDRHDATTPKQEDVKPKKNNGRRRVRGRKNKNKKGTGTEDGDDEELSPDEPAAAGALSPASGEKPLPELPRELSTTALDDMHDKERLVISDNIIGESLLVI